jgi:hypothetical protein
MFRHNTAIQHTVAIIVIECESVYHEVRLKEHYNRIKWTEYLIQ